MSDSLVNNSSLTLILPFHGAEYKDLYDVLNKPRINEPMK